MVFLPAPPLARVSTDVLIAAVTEDGGCIVREDSAGRDLVADFPPRAPVREEFIVENPVAAVPPGVVQKSERCKKMHARSRFASRLKVQFHVPHIDIFSVRQKDIRKQSAHFLSGVGGLLLPLGIGAVNDRGG